MNDLGAVNTDDLRAELRTRDEETQRQQFEALRCRLRDAYGVCDCGEEWDSVRCDNFRPIRMSGLFGHKPGYYGDEFDVILECPDGHEQRRPGVSFFKKPMVA